MKSWAKETIGRPPFAVVGAAKEAYVNMIKWASRTGSSHSITEVFYLLINLKSDLLGSKKAYTKVKQTLGTCWKLIGWRMSLLAALMMIAAKVP